MSFISTLTSLFSSKPSSENEAVDTAESVEYKGFLITPTPMAEGGQYRLSATITKEIQEVMKTHLFIRSDVIASRDDCIAMTIRKTKIAIDQMDDNIFN